MLARVADLDVELIVTQPRGKDRDYLRLNPQAKIPTFQSTDGQVVLREVMAIAYYFLRVSPLNLPEDERHTALDQPQALLGRSPLEAAQILQWVSFANQEISPPIATWYRPAVGKPTSDGPSPASSRSAALLAISVVEAHLGPTRHYLVAGRLTLADLFVASLMMRGFEFVLDRQWREENPNVSQWYERVTSLPVWRAIVPNPLLCDVSVDRTVAARVSAKL